MAERTFMQEDRHVQKPEGKRQQIIGGTENNSVV